MINTFINEDIKLHFEYDREYRDLTDSSVEGKLEEYFYCKTHPLYFVENYIYLPISGADELMKLYKPQKKFFKSIIEDHHIIALKSRQVGISTITQTICVYLLMFYKNVIISMVSRGGDESTSFCGKVKHMIDHLPDWLKPRLTKDREQQVHLENGSKFYASQVNEKNPGSLFRGSSTTLAIIDEAAFIKHIDEAFQGFGPSLVKAHSDAERNNVPYGTVVISTPNKTVGTGKWFFDKWSDANSTEASIYVPHKIHWKEIDQFANDPNWYKQQCELLHNDDIAIRQELEMQFLASSDSFFPAKVVEKLNEIPEPALSSLDIEGMHILQWEKPNPYHFYLIGVDSASSSGKDNSAIQVVNYETFEQAAEFSGKLRVDNFCKIIDIITKIYPRNLLIVENNSYGNQVVETLTKMGMEYNLYSQKLKNVKNTKTTGTRYRYGLSTNAVTRPLIMDAVYTYIVENVSTVKSIKLALELMGLVETTTGKIVADKGLNDDLVMALAFCAYVRMYDPPLGMNTDMRSTDIENIMETIDMNSEGTSQLSNRLRGLQLSGQGNIREYNKAISEHIKDKLFEMVSDGPIIDINDILGLTVEIE